MAVASGPAGTQLSFAQMCTWETFSSLADVPFSGILSCAVAVATQEKRYLYTVTVRMVDRVRLHTVTGL